MATRKLTVAGIFALDLGDVLIARHRSRVVAWKFTVARLLTNILRGILVTRHYSFVITGERLFRWYLTTPAGFATFLRASVLPRAVHIDQFAGLLTNVLKKKRELQQKETIWLLLAIFIGYYLHQADEQKTRILNRLTGWPTSRKRGASYFSWTKSFIAKVHLSYRYQHQKASGLSQAIHTWCWCLMVIWPIIR